MAFTTRFTFNTVINNTELDLHFISKIFQHFIHSVILSKYIARGSPALSNCECYKIGDQLDPIIWNLFVWRVTKVSVFNSLLSIRKFLMSFSSASRIDSTTGNRITYYLLTKGLKEEWTKIWSLAILIFPKMVSSI